MKHRTAVAGLALSLVAACAASPTPEPAGGNSGRSPWSWGPEFQAYPAGGIFTVNAQRELSGSDAVIVRAGVNVTERQDFGEHDDESGSGVGLGVGYRRWIDPAADGTWWWGGRVDLWQLGIDWEDDPSPGFPGGRVGSTDVLVVQPTAEFGYSWRLGPGRRIEVGASLGAEINVDTDGEDVGEGAILLVGVRALFGGR